MDKRKHVETSSLHDRLKKLTQTLGLTTSLALSSLLNDLKFTRSESNTFCGVTESGFSFFSSAAKWRISFMITRRWSLHHSELSLTTSAIIPLILFSACISSNSSISISREATICRIILTVEALNFAWPT